MVANCCTLTDERECSPPPPLPSPSSAASKSLGRRHHRPLAAQPGRREVFELCGMVGGLCVA